jgi:predicted kinase
MPALNHPATTTGSGVLVALVGPPGAGKTTLRDRFPGVVVVSLDDNRRALSCCAMNQAVTPLAAEMAHNAVRTALAAGRTVLWDATSAERADRAGLLLLAHEYGARTRAVVLLPPLRVVLARNATRDFRPCACGHARRVPDPVVRAMHAAITRDLPGLHGEGWHHVHHHTDHPAA